MWWRHELEQRRQEVEALRKQMQVNEASSGSQRPASRGLPIKELAALGFAAASIVGPLRAARILLLAASAIKATRAAKDLLKSETAGTPSSPPASPSIRNRWSGMTPSARNHRQN